MADVILPWSGKPSFPFFAQQQEALGTDQDQYQLLEQCMH
ncbi:hypothetical protein PF66_01727, partial [Pseudomonas asplenii]